MLFPLLENSSKGFDFPGDYIPLNSQEWSDSGDGFASGALKQENKAHNSKTIAVESDGTDTEMLMRHVRAEKQSEKDFHHESDENERALLQLGQRNKKRPLPSTSKLSRAKKSCVQRGSDSDDSDDSFILCELCHKKWPKVDYAEHVDNELAERAKMEHVPRKLEGIKVAFILPQVCYPA